MDKSNLMRRSQSMVLCVAAGVMLMACATPYSEAPIATNFLTTKQHKLQAGSHWNAIAADTAESVANSVKLGKGCIAPTPECNLVFVREVRNPSQFARAFRTQFITSLVNKGINVALTPAGAFEIDFDIQAVRFSPRRPDGTFYSATAIYAGLWAMHGLWTDTSPGAAGVLAVGAFDVNRWITAELASGPTPDHEIIITASATRNDRYLGRVTNVYYVAGTDAWLYSSPPPVPVLRTLSVTGGA